MFRSLACVIGLALGPWYLGSVQQGSINSVSVQWLDFRDLSTAALKEEAQAVIPAMGARARGRSEDRYRAHLAGRVATRRLLAGLGVEAWVAKDSRHGYPKLVDKNGETLANTYINISHTETIAVAAVGQHPVGIDVERVDRDASRVLERISTPAETEWVWQHPKSVEGTPSALVLWCAKESISKAIGSGVVFGLNQVEVRLGSGSLFAVEIGIHGPLKIKEPVVELRRVTGMLLAVCSEKSAMGNGFRLTKA